MDIKNRKRWIILTAVVSVLLIVGINLVGFGAEKVKINCVSSPDNADALTDFSKEFMAKYPDIKVKVVPLSWEVLTPRILADFASHAGAYDTMTWDLMSAGAYYRYLADLDKIRKEYPDIVDPNYDIDDFIPLAWHVYGTWGEKNIGLPFYGAAMFLFYRKDLFEDPVIKAKFKEMFGKELEVPKTREEAIQVSKFFTKKYNPDSPTKYGVALMFPRTHTLFYMYLNYFGPLRRSPAGIAKFGEVDFEYGDFFTADHKPAFNSLEGLKALELMKTQMAYSPDPLGSDYGETLEYFSKGLVAMVPQWTACIASWKTSPELSPFNEKVGVAIIPGGYPVSGGWGLGINNDCKHKKEAYMWIQFATDKRHDKLHWLRYNVGPARYSTCRDPEVLKEYPWLKDIYIRSLERASNRPRIPEEPKLEDITVGVLSEILLGRKPATLETLQKLADQWMRILKH